MDFVQIGTIDPAVIEDDSQREWLESLSDEDNLNFVEVEDGDYSQPRQIVTEVIPYTAHRLLGGYINLSPIDYDPDVYAEIVRDREEAPTAFGGEKAFRPYEL